MKDYKSLEVQIEVLIDYMQVMIVRGDWHGVSDAANDLRELEVQVRNSSYESWKSHRDVE
ncbi:MAG: hypothetical protein EB114_11085 [Betaproteobacteria bacterium]|nr:hypothetical protein [Betaproteobacteria bacterium]